MNIGHWVDLHQGPSLTDPLLLEYVLLCKASIIHLYEPYSVNLIDSSCFLMYTQRKPATESSILTLTPESSRD